MKTIITAAAFAAITATSAFAGACGAGTQPADTGNFWVQTPATIANVAATLGQPGQHLGTKEN